MESAYEAKKYEDGIYAKWESANAFYAKIDKTKKPFVISMPPPNATGVLHLGHAVMLAIQDIMVRQQRMKGLSSLWLPGTDHAAIATQSVVEKELQAQGIKNPREELGREKLLSEIRDFVDKSKDTIRNQVRKIGASCDWSREEYTLNENMNHAVNTLFRYMYEDGIIYRGGRAVNWDPNMQTTVADDELEYKEEKAKFYYFQFGPVVIGTARPETKFADKIIVVHPEDERYKDLIGKEFDVEWIEGTIKARVIADDCIDMNLGTGAMTITPAHSKLDFDLSQKHDLETPQIIDFDGKIRKDISPEFGGLDVKEAREKVVEKLRSKGLLVKVDEEYVHNIAVNYRGKGTIEPQIMRQWFIDVNKPVIDWKGQKMSIKEVLRDAVSSKMIKINPARFEKTYFHWIDNLQDWCISRQIWWGHQIPVWYKATDDQCKQFNAIKNASSVHLNILQVEGETRYGIEAPEPTGWLRDPDTLDTWFSSAIWTFATLGWPEKTEELEYFHPTSVLETGYDILFFWVARMILASTYALRKDGFSEENSIPFKNVYLHGLIRDKNGKKMSKSNPETCIDPLEMIDKYGADALRLSLVIGSSPGNDMRLYEEKIAGYRNFINKIWNASRFVITNITEDDLEKTLSESDIKSAADKWILTELQTLIVESEKDLKNFRFSDAGNRIYDFIWNQYCDWYLEMSKGEAKNPTVLLHVLINILQLMHPFTPFVTEKIWESLGREELLINSKWPELNKALIFTKEHEEIEKIKAIITQIRSSRAELKVDPAKKIRVIIYGDKHTETLTENSELIKKLARLEELEIHQNGANIEGAKKEIIHGMEIFLPLKELIDTEKEKKRIADEIKKKEAFVKGLEGKLGNPGFREKAPEQIIKQEEARLQEEKENIEKLRKELDFLV